ncbi:MAG: hypothetical protein V2I66_09315 [Halieaceae bacterium]|nr:hypothetical protein [Halieaceae bacterium]
MSKVLGFLKKEFLEMLPPTIFFFCVFHIMAFARALMEDRLGVGSLSSVAATIGALVLGKSILVADALPVWHLLDRLPRVYLIIARTVAYALVALCFQFLEEFIPAFREAGSAGAAIAAMREEVYWPHFWAAHILLLVFLALYNIIAVMMEAMGAAQVHRLLFSHEAAGSASGEPPN